MGRRGYPPEFRRRALDLLDACRKVVDLARGLGISNQTIYAWRRQEDIDRGLVAGLTSAEREELAAAKRRIRELEAELAIHRRAFRTARGAQPPKRRAPAAMADTPAGGDATRSLLRRLLAESGAANRHNLRPGTVINRRLALIRPSVARTRSAIRSANASVLLGRGGRGVDGRDRRSTTRRTVLCVVAQSAAAARKLPSSLYADRMSNCSLADFKMGVPRGCR